MTVTLNPPPTTADAGADQEHCDAASFSLNGNSPTVGNGQWSLLFAPGTGTFTPDASSPIATFTPDAGDEYGTFVFTWEISNGECSNADQELCNQTSTTMAATAVTTGSGTWSQVSGPNTATIATARKRIRIGNC